MIPGPKMLGDPMPPIPPKPSESEPPVAGSATCSAIHESIERLLTLAGIATEPGWDIWDSDLPHKLNLARETFKAAYDKNHQHQTPMIDPQPLKPHQERVVYEKEQLDDKLQKLTTFIGGATYQTLDPAERFRLNRQLEVMRLYSNILSERIEAWTS